MRLDIYPSFTQMTDYNTTQYKAVANLLSYTPKGLKGKANFKPKTVWLVNQGRFPTGLLSRAQHYLDCTTLPPNTNSYIPNLRQSQAFEPQKVECYDYQAEAAIAALKSRPRMGGVIRIPTRGGKTWVAAKVITILRVPTLYVVPSKALLRSTHDKLVELLGTPEQIGMVGGGNNNPLFITVATIQSLRKRPELFIGVPLVIIDEAHHTPAPTLFSTILQSKDAVCVLGLTATPWRDDGHDMMIEAVCGPVVYRISASDLIDQGRIVPPTIHVHKFKLDKELEDLPLNELSYATNYQRIVVENEKRNDFIRSLAVAHIEAGRLPMVSVRRVEHGAALEKLIPLAKFVDGSCSEKDREASFSTFKEGYHRCLITTSIGNEGLDFPPADALINASCGRSSVEIMQKIGRILCPYPGKREAWVDEIVDSHPILRNQFFARQRMYQNEPRFKVTHES